MSAVADGPEADLVRAECFSQVVQIVGALVRVVTGKIDALDVVPVKGATTRALAQLLYRGFTRWWNVEWESKPVETGKIGFGKARSTLIERDHVCDLTQSHEERK